MELVPAEMALQTVASVIQERRRWHVAALTKQYDQLRLPSVNITRQHSARSPFLLFWQNVFTLLFPLVSPVPDLHGWKIVARGSLGGLNELAALGPVASQSFVVNPFLTRVRGCRSSVAFRRA